MRFIRRSVADLDDQMAIVYLQIHGRNEGLPYIPEDLQLLVTVLRCSNLPMRATGEAMPLPPPRRGAFMLD